MTIKFLWRKPGNHHFIRQEEGKQPIPRIGETVVIAEVGYTVRSVIWMREDGSVQVELD